MFLFKKIISIPVAIWALIILGIISSIPFMMGPADGWDHVGHQEHIMFQKEMLPKIVFWNPTFFSGYDQFLSYPPFFTILIAVFSFILGLSLSYKLVVVFSWILFPLAFYLFSLNFLSEKKAAFVAWASSLWLYLNVQQTGVNFFSTFVIGNVQHLLAVSLSFLSLHFILRKRWKVSVFLLALLFLTHQITALMMGFLLLFIVFENRKLIILVLAPLLSAVWWIPYILEGSRQIKTHDDYFFTSLELLFLLFFLSVSFYKVIKEQDSSILPFASFSLFFALLSIFVRFTYPELWSSLPFHYHRFKPMMLLVLFPIGLSSLSTLKDIRAFKNLRRYLKKRGSMLFYIFVILSSVLIIHSSFGYSGVLSASYSAPEISETGRRVLVVDGKTSPVFRHSLHYAIASDGTWVSKGLFVEATPLSRWYFDLEQILLKEGLLRNWWGIRWDFMPILSDGSFLLNINNYLDLFGIDTIVAQSDISIPDGWAVVQDKSSSNPLVLRRYSNSLVEKADSLLFSDDSDAPWDVMVSRWFFSKPDKFLVQGKKILFRTDAIVSLESVKNHGNLISIGVYPRSVSTLPVAVIVKMGFSPRWKAVSSSGKELEIIRAAPDYMLILADEPFILSYSGIWTLPLLIGASVSFLSLLSCLLLFRFYPEFWR